ncbi:MAG: hypothetical protein AAB920_00140 [Patescibacteria group bacterium]
MSYDNKASRKSSASKRRAYIITAAQNVTPIHKNFWASLMQAVQYYNAELKVIPGRYRNPTSHWTQNNESDEAWADEVMPYLCKDRISLNERIMILGDIKVQWATGSPLAQLDALTKGKSGVVGHPNRALRSIATPQHKQPKIMFTTGACTIGNYTDTKRGKIGASNHCLGALIVEIDGDVFYARQLNADKYGCFIDLDVEFTPTGVKRAQRALSLTPGDVHDRWKRPDVVRATFTAKDSMMKRLRPKYLVVNDLADAYARNHHHRDDWPTRFGIWKFGIESVEDEIRDSIRFLNHIIPDYCRGVVVSCNHHDAILKYIKESDFRFDSPNTIFFLKSALEIAESVRRGTGGITYNDPFIACAKKYAKKNIRFLKRGESFVLANVEYSLHGDKGPNGVRGTTKNLSALGVKVSKGHDHNAGIIDGCYSTGVCTGPLEYEGGGPSSHSNAHVIQYANGKRVILFVINGRYCLPRPAPPEE